MLVLAPAAAVVLEDVAGRVPLGRRGDMSSWSLPTGGAEAASSFARTALAEVAEETGVVVDERDLVPYACYSDGHVVSYPSGDVTHWFALCFVVTRWRGEPRADGEEMRELGFFDLAEPPDPLQDSTREMLALYARFKQTGCFQVA